LIYSININQPGQLFRLIFLNTYFATKFLFSFWPVSNSEISELPSGSVTVHFEYRTGLVEGASVTIKLNGWGSNLFGTPMTTNSNGIITFDNGGSYFPNGSYEVKATKFGFGDGVTTLNIVNGVPVYPIVSVNIGTH